MILILLPIFAVVQACSGFGFKIGPKRSFEQSWRDKLGTLIDFGNLVKIPGAIAMVIHATITFDYVCATQGASLLFVKNWALFKPANFR